jgi:hypothetical protein
VCTDRATAVNALDAITMSSGFVDPDLLWWMIPTTHKFDVRASAAIGSRARRTSASLCVSSRESMRDSNGSSSSSAASTLAASSATVGRSWGKLSPL